MICTLQRTVSTTKTYNFDWFSATLFVPNFETGNAIPRQQLLPSLRHYRISFAAFLTLWYYGCMFSVFLLQYFQTSFISVWMRRRLKTSVKLLILPVLTDCSVGIQEKNWRNIYPSQCGFELTTLLYIVHKFGNIRSRWEWYSIHQIGEFRYGAKHKFTRRCTSVSYHITWFS